MSTPFRLRSSARWLTCLLAAFAALPTAFANSGSDGNTAPAPASAVDRARRPDMQVRRNVAYGTAPKQTLDIHLPDLPKEAPPAPILFMVHGGAWRIGDKAHRAVFENKVRHWVPAGWVFVSVNYRMMPDADPLEQARDVARALAYVQSTAGTFRGDPKRIVLMGHSAGAHLVALLSANPQMAFDLGAKPWIGTVALDSAAVDVVQIMSRPHLRLYDEAFGKDPDFWRQTSPYHHLSKTSVAPMLLVCSSERIDSPRQAKRFADQAKEFGLAVSVHEEALSHGDINEHLGLPGSYTDAVDAFLRECLSGAAPRD